MPKGLKLQVSVGLVFLSHQKADLQAHNTGVIPISLFLLATGTVLRKAAIDRGVRLATGRYGCRYRGVTS